MTTQKLITANNIQQKIESLRSFTNWNPTNGVSQIKFYTIDGMNVTLDEDSDMFIDSLTSDIRTRCIDQIVKLQKEFDSL